MSRRGDGIRRYTVKDKSTGRDRTMYLARVRVKDDKGILRTKEQAFENEDAAKLFQAQERLTIKLGRVGKELERNRLLGDIKLGQLVESRQTQMLSLKGENENKPVLGSNEYDMLERFKKDKICSLFIGEIDHTTLDDYVDRRKNTGAGLATIDRELNPVRRLCDLARRGKLSGQFRGKCLEFEPFKNFEIGEYKSTRHRWLKTPEEEAQIYKAIDEQCRTDLLKARWLTFVVLALSTGLRRRVMLNLKWEDVLLEHNLIVIKPEYWSGKKRAPPYVPISKRLDLHLIAYQMNLPSEMRKPTERLFPYTESGIETYWDRIIERTTLFETRIKSGHEVKDYLNIHALRHTCETRYDQKPYQLTPKEYGYLLGHRRLNEDDRQTRTQQNYNHWDDRRHREMCADIQKAIDTAENVINDDNLGKMFDALLDKDHTRHSMKSLISITKNIDTSSEEYKERERVLNLRATLRKPRGRATKKVKLQPRNTQWQKEGR